MDLVETTQAENAYTKEVLAETEPLQATLFAEMKGRIKEDDSGVPAPERRERASDVLHRVGLGHRLDNRPNQLSGGQQQRVAIARAIINHPSLLLADEPTGALDSQTTTEVLNLFDELNQEGITILLVTHEDEVGARAQRVVHFRDGRIVT